jgi:hypothetical protein
MERQKKNLILEVKFERWRLYSFMSECPNNNNLMCKNRKKLMA